MKPPDGLNGEQRRAVDCDRNAVAAAGAGSGKTMVLASRYVRLIRSGAYRVDQILTLTFTRKAAAEMYRRIYGALKAESRDSGGRGVNAALADFSRARIQTLDSYCAYIVRQGASRYGIRPDFRIDNEGARELADRESLPFLIPRRRHPALERLYRGKRPTDIARQLFAASAFSYGYIDEPAAYTRSLTPQHALIRRRWEETTEKLLPLADELAALEAGEDDFLIQLRPAAERWAGIRKSPIGGEELGAYFDRLLAAEDPVEEAEAHPLRGRCLQWLKVTGDLAYANAARGKRNSRAKEIVRELRGLFRVFSSILIYVLQGGIIISTMTLLEEFQKIYVEKKRARGILTFTDVARLARTILRDQADIRNSEKAAFKAIMIDEFQDNNSLQKELLFLLAEKQDHCAGGIPPAAGLEEKKLFFVGDEKQSIYRFRGADVSVFRELKNELGAENLSLGTNYRSSPQLIACFNALFGGSVYDPTGTSPLFQYAAVFPPSGLPPYEADYSPLAAGTNEGGNFRICILNSEDEGEEENFGNIENEAAFIAARIRELLDKGDEDGLCEAGDIAILFRTRRPQGLFEKHLRLLDIPYAGENLSGFFADGPVNDMAAFLRLVAYPLDTEAYAVTLRSPFAGLSLRGLALCINAFSEPEFRGQPFSPPVPLDEGDRRAYEGGGELYRRFRDLAPELSTGELLSRLWYEEGYRYETLWNSRVRSHREIFDYLYAQALKADEEGLSLAAFSDRLEALREREEPLEDMEIPLERSGAVRLLTIHKSKGLEFKVVFIVCCDSRGGSRRNDRDIYYSASGLSFNPPLPPECTGMEGRNFFYEEDRLEERRRETAELRRLLYVAMTRARRSLCLSGSFPLGEGGFPTLGAALDKKKKDRAKKDEEQGFRPLEGDSILDNGSFFGLLLPTLCEPRPWLEEGKFREGAPPYLAMELIPPLGPQILEKRKERGYANGPSGLARFFRDRLPLYSGGAVISTPVLRDDHLSPSAVGEFLKSGGAGHPITEGAPCPSQAPGLSPSVPPLFRHDPALSGGGAEDIFALADPILSRTGAFAEFGSLVHLCAEARLTGKTERLPPGLAGRLRPGEAETLLEAGRGIAGRFLASPLGIQAAGAARRWNEYPFRSLWETGGEASRESSGPWTGESGGVFVNGVIDLLYEWEEELRIADFKTDSEERPEEHLAQMAIYRRAARELQGKPCRVWLYYLRSGRAVEVTDFCL